MNESLALRFFQKIEKVDNGCWIWKGAKNHKGYGRIGVDNINRRAHHVSLVLFRGKKFSDFSLDNHTDHLCNNPSCVNPAHLEIVSAKENRKRQTIRRRVSA